MSGTAVRVHGAASDEEIAAVVAALHRGVDGRSVESGYARWRRQRQAALRSSRSITFYSPVAGSRPSNRRLPGKS
jgi:hypothetical protein